MKGRGEMTIRRSAAVLAGRACIWSMTKLFHRNASTLPGRVALAVDPGVLESLGTSPTEGSLVICGTNGKTTTTNLLASAIQDSGKEVACNWIGANMASGVTSALLAKGAVEWGVFENDELSTVHVVPKVKPRAFLLLNLFRDQLDRCGEIDHVQDVIYQALSASPDTEFLYTADDPLCQGIAVKLKKQGSRVTSIGIRDDLGLVHERVRGGAFCQVCGSPLVYDFRHYGQLGSYRCAKCDFARGELDYAAANVKVSPEGVAFDVIGRKEGPLGHLHAPWGGVYMVYNLLGAFVASLRAGVSAEQFQKTVNHYDPKNGRLQRFDVLGRKVTLNLAKNPTGFNQNLALLMGDDAPKAVYIVINDDFNDGKDVSWLWDVDFERLNDIAQKVVYVGGHRANDMQVRLKYAGVEAKIVDNVAGFLDDANACPRTWGAWVLTNYSALWPVKADLERLGEAL